MLKKLSINTRAKQDDFKARILGVTILLRCVGTIKWILKLIDKGYLRESFSLLKYIQEDTAVAYVHFNKKLMRFQDIKGPASISEIKEAIPMFGETYGLQNKISHYYYKMMRDSVSISKKSRDAIKVNIHLNVTDPEFKAIIAAHCYYMLHQSYLSVFDLITASGKEELQYWTIADDGSRKHRMPKNIMKKFEDWSVKLGLDSEANAE